MSIPAAMILLIGSWAGFMRVFLSSWIDHGMGIMPRRYYLFPSIEMSRYFFAVLMPDGKKSFSSPGVPGPDSEHRAINDIIDKCGESGYITGMEHGSVGETRDDGDACPACPFWRCSRWMNVLFSVTETRDVTDHETDETKKNILCKTCGNPITSDDAGIVMNGSHEHTFMNPRGMVFRIGCFSRAGDAISWVPLPMNIPGFRVSSGAM